MFGKVEICGINTSKLALLTDDEKDELIKKSKEGDTAAREKLINGNLRLVLSVIQKFANRTDNQDDIFQVGCIGLIKAVDNFDVSLNVRFSTYAVPMIIGEIRRYLRDNSMLRVSRSLKNLAYCALKEKERLSSLLGRDPTFEEIADAVNAFLCRDDDISGDENDTSKASSEEHIIQRKTVTPHDISEALDSLIAPASIYDPVFSDNGDSIDLYEQIADTGAGMEEWTENIAVSQAIGKLSERERKIIALRFFKGRTQVEIADEIGISQAQVSRLEKGAIQKMKKQL